MKQNDEQKFCAALMAVAAVHRVELSQQVMRLYWSALEQYEVEEVMHALTVLMRDPDCGQWMPKPADVVRVIDGGKASKSALAWERVDKAMRCAGGNSSVVFDDPIIHAALSTLGQWPELCATATDELHFLRQRFEKAYQAMCLSPPKGWPKKLIGRYEAYNAPRGLATEQPIPIGDVGKCREVYRAGKDCGQVVAIGGIGQKMLEKK
jgi:hypothetical protein